MKLLIAGDFYVSEKFRNQELFSSSVEELFTKADYRIVNLEAPISANEPKNRILKTGPHLRSSASTILSYLKQLRIDTVTLANNHILDYGGKGLSDTFNFLYENRIDHVGAGSNLKDAAKPLTIEKDGLQIALLNFAENEWSIADENTPGANPLDIISNVKQINAAKASHDKIIVIIHGGHEYYQLPSPRMVKQYRFYADNGADVIIGHHSHCISGYEVYNDIPIIYSLGNFVFTLPSKHDSWHSGLLVKLNIFDNSPVTFELIPVRQERKKFNVSLIPEDKKTEIIDKINETNKIIINQKKLTISWNKFIQQKSKEYLNLLSPINTIKNRYVRAVLNKIQLNKVILNKNYLKNISVLMSCEAHADAAKEVIRWFLKKK